ncbi:MAG: E3 binding domain-containing protein, partial [Firmicutes bacterium]|nr:E3 binding domain-containing protein [Bacillota bacterium]
EPTDCLKPGAAPAVVEVAAEVAAPVAEAAAPVAVAADGAPVSPRAAKLAKAYGVDASMAIPTGPNGRIIERDVQKLIDSGVKPVAAAAAAVENSYEDVKFSGIRRAISKSMSTSLHTMAQLTHNTSFDATAILKTRRFKFWCKSTGPSYSLHRKRIK